MEFTSVESVKIPRRQSEIREALAEVVQERPPDRRRNPEWNRSTRNTARTRPATVPPPSGRYGRREAGAELETRAAGMGRHDRPVRNAPGCPIPLHEGAPS